MTEADLKALEEKYLATTRSREWVWNRAGAVWLKEAPPARDVHVASVTPIYEHQRYSPPPAERLANAAFIAAAHAAVPALLARVRELEGVLGDVMQDCGPGPDALRAAHRRGQEAMRGRAVEACREAYRREEDQGVPDHSARYGITVCKVSVQDLEVSDP